MKKLWPPCHAEHPANIFGYYYFIQSSFANKKTAKHKKIVFHVKHGKGVPGWSEHRDVEIRVSANESLLASRVFHVEHLLCYVKRGNMGNLVKLVKYIANIFSIALFRNAVILQSSKSCGE